MTESAQSRAHTDPKGYLSDPTDAEVAEVQARLESAQSQVRYRAHFTPEAWIGDNAIEVDAEGEQSWDCTRAVTANADYFARLEASGYKGSLDDGLSGLLDNDDVLRDDPDAPEWVRNWHGPFSIHVFRQVPSGT